MYHLVKFNVLTARKISILYNIYRSLNTKILHLFVLHLFVQHYIYKHFKIKTKETSWGQFCSYSYCDRYLSLVRWYWWLPGTFYNTQTDLEIIILTGSSIWDWWWPGNPPVSRNFTVVCCSDDLANQPWKSCSCQ